MSRVKSPKCKRLIPPDKYEHADPDVEIWWQNLFEEFEKERAVPDTHRREILMQVFPRNVVNKICEIIGCVEMDSVGPTDYPSVTSLEFPTQHASNETICSKNYHSRKSGSQLLRELSESEESSTTIPKLHPTSIKSKESYSREKLFDEVGRHRNVGKTNPYLNFFKRPVARAAIWRPLPPLSYEQMSLTEKADAITESIAQNFVQWLESIGGDRKHTLDVSTIKKMFQIGFHTHAATSLCVRIKEMPSVPEEVANARLLTGASKRENLHRQLKRDIESCEVMKHEQMYAFGKMLPAEMRIKPTTENITTKWLTCSRIPESLETMSTVWQGITTLRSTKGFCNWLLDHPEIPQPSYLKRMGMLSEDLRGKRVSLDSSRKSYGMPSTFN